jgi:hypothetical protein
MGFANLLAESAEIDIRGPEGSKSEKVYVITQPLYIGTKDHIL